MTSTAILVGDIDSFPYPVTVNWQKALGGHYIWMSADVEVSVEGRTFNMSLVVHAEDRYNFNPGQSDIASGIPDAANGRFEVTGLAKQYMNYSTLQRYVQWETGVAGPPRPIISRQGRRQGRRSDRPRALGRP
jgi:hypothetical protein